MRKVLVVSNGTFVSSTFAQRFPNHEIKVTTPHQLPATAHEDKYNLIVLDVPSGEILTIKETLIMMCQKFRTPIVAVTDSFADVSALSTELAEAGPFPILVKPVDAEMVVSLGEAFMSSTRDDIEKMIFNVSDEAIKRTDKCQYGFSCLNNDGWTFNGCVGNKDIRDFLNLKEKKSEHCSYLISFGQSSYFCQCPVRLEIYQKYNV